MANYRSSLLISGEPATIPATKIIELGSSEIISRIGILYSATNNSAVPAGHPSKMITKVEIVSGGSVLCSLSGAQLDTIDLLEHGEHDARFYNFTNVHACDFQGCIYFGRYLYDPEYAFDPRKFKNVQLKITHNCTLGGSAPNAAALTVFADVFDEKAVTPKGFILNQQMTSYTLVAGTRETIDCFTDRPIRKFFVGSLSPGSTPAEQINKVKLYEDGGRKIIIDNEKLSDLIRKLPNNKFYTETVRTAIGTTDVRNYCTPSYDTTTMFTPISGDDCGYTGTEAKGGTFFAKGTVATVGDILITGKGPNGYVVFPFGDIGTGEDFYDVSRLSSLTFVITAGSACVENSTCEIIVQQIYYY